jgi:hypothetical protein
VRFRFEHLADPAVDGWQYAGAEEGGSAEEALERMHESKDLPGGWYKARTPDGETAEFLVDGTGVTAVS